MSIFTQYVEKLHLKAASKMVMMANSRVLDDFRNLETVGVLLEVTNVLIRNEALSFIKALKEEAQNVEILGYCDTKELKEDFTFDCFCKKDLDWIWRPKHLEAVEKFKKQKFDLLINLCQTKCLPLSYIAISVKATYKIAALTDYPNNYDLLLEAKNFENYLKQISFFLAKFTNQHETV